MAETDALTIEMEPVRGGQEFGPVQPEPQQINGVTEEQIQAAAAFDRIFGELAPVTAKQALEAEPYDAELVNSTIDLIRRAGDRAEEERREDLSRKQKQEWNGLVVSQAPAADRVTERLAIIDRELASARQEYSDAGADAYMDRGRARGVVKGLETLRSAVVNGAPPSTSEERNRHVFTSNDSLAFDWSDRNVAEYVDIRVGGVEDELRRTGYVFERDREVVRSQNWGSTSELSKEEIIAQGRLVRTRLDELAAKLDTAEEAERLNIRDEMKPLALRENELRDEYFERKSEETQEITEDWLYLEAHQIRAQAADSVFEDADEAALGAAYYNGRRETYNSAREYFIGSHPEAAERLPVIGIDEIQVRTREQVLGTPGMEIGA